MTAGYAIDTLSRETVDAVVIGDGPAGLNGALMPDRSHHPHVGSAADVDAAPGAAGTSPTTT
ncbi:hypothetical protein [Streptomyces malaysiense]|uniref:Uncharacterized protein n=1 Tax=Streptomyces malaysiense TaxID=1428626 RepID=A0A1J4PX82_9ACTN|nr:hypothetical protein [Streptomyces malaysiense]OIK24710.1 hypothetical protein VT52_025785 [Streptomyces malaysiense]